MHPTEGGGRRRFGARALLVLGITVVVLAVWAVTLTSAGDGSGASADEASGSRPTVTSAPVPVAFEAPARRVVLPPGAEQVDEYPTRFPHTPEGAAAAAVALTRYSASLDYQVVNEVLRLYATHAQATDAQATEAVDAAAAAAVSAGRARLELPMAGPAPLDASVFAEPFGVQWTTKGADKVVVSVLSAVEYRSGAQQTRELVAATTVWTWNADAQDWRVTPAAPGTIPPIAEIGSVEFNTHGWAALAERRA